MGPRGAFVLFDTHRNIRFGFGSWKFCIHLWFYGTNRRYEITIRNSFYVPLDALRPSSFVSPKQHTLESSWFYLNCCFLFTTHTKSLAHSPLINVVDDKKKEIKKYYSDKTNKDDSQSGLQAGIYSLLLLFAKYNDIIKILMSSTRNNPLHAASIAKFSTFLKCHRVAKWRKIVWPIYKY